MLHNFIHKISETEYMAVHHWHYGTKEIHIYKILRTEIDANNWLRLKKKNSLFDFLTKYANHRAAAYSHGTIDAEKVAAIAFIRCYLTSANSSNYTFDKAIQLFEKHWSKIITIQPTPESIFYDCWHTGLQDISKILPTNPILP